MLNKSNPEKQAEVMSLIRALNTESYYIDTIEDSETIALYNSSTDVRITIESYMEFIEDCAIDFLTKYTE